MSADVVTTLNAALPALALPQRLKLQRESIEGRIVFTTSLGIEDQVITHEIFTNDIDIAVVTLDTGRLFPESYKLWAATEERYGKRIRAYYPDTGAVEELIGDQGIDGFYHALEFRKACCDVRKVEPLGRALSGAAAWITGLRADQSANRQGFAFAERDAARGLIKINPFLDWSREQAVAFASANGVPVNALHAQGFLSIGCAPCTRALAPGEPERAGRWWWEDEAKKECGLHVDAAGRLTRIDASKA